MRGDDWGQWYDADAEYDAVNAAVIDHLIRNPDQAYRIAKGLSGEYSMGDIHVYSAADFEREARKNVWWAIHEFGPSESDLDGDLPYVIWYENRGQAWSCDGDRLASSLTSWLMGDINLRSIVDDPSFKAGAGLRAAVKEAKRRYKGASPSRSPKASTRRATAKTVRRQRGGRP